MKTTLSILILIALCTQPIFAQDEDGDKKKYRGGTHNHFDIDLGLNNWLEDGSNPSGASYEVKPWGSWYVALKSINSTHTGGAFYLLWGPDVSFYSFKFEDERTRLIKNEEVMFIPEEIDNARKSKLEVIYVGFSAVPMIQFGNKQRDRHWHHDDFVFGHGARGFRMGVGAYGGYRLGSKAKYVVNEGGKDKTKDHDNFYLQNWRYGVRFQAGFGDVDFFFNYDLNELFSDGRGPELNAISFGVTL